MALDFHHTTDNELIFSLSEKQFNLLHDIFNQYFYRSGVRLDYYQDQQLRLANQQVLCKIIDDYIQQTDLNRDKKKTVTIIEFQSLLKFCIAKNYDLAVLAD